MNVCKYCGKSFVRESTLTSHLCERKRRFQQENEIGVQWGLQAYIKFYETTQSAKKRSYEDFVNSSYYTAFVKFGRHCHAIHCINFTNFTSWLLKNNKKLDNWASDAMYNEWLLEYLKKENHADALERSIITMIDYANENKDLRNNYRDYFRLVNENRICYHIMTGRISSWAIYNSISGQDFLARLNEEQAASVIAYIDPDFWNAKFKDFAQDVEHARNILDLAGL